MPGHPTDAAEGVYLNDKDLVESYGVKEFVSQ